MIVWDVGPDGGFGTRTRASPAAGWRTRRRSSNRAGWSSRRRGRCPPDGQAIPYLGPGTLGVAATFIDPRTGEVVDQVEVGDTVEDAYFGASVAVSPDGRWVAVTSGLATTVLDARTRDVVKRIVLPPNGDAGWTAARTRPASCAARCGRRRLTTAAGNGGYLPGTTSTTPRRSG